MHPTEIKAQCTYRTTNGALYYVQDISGEKVTYCRVGETDRREASLRRFAAVAIVETENQ